MFHTHAIPHKSTYKPTYMRKHPHSYHMFTCTHTCAHIIPNYDETTFEHTLTSPQTNTCSRMIQANIHRQIETRRLKLTLMKTLKQRHELTHTPQGPRYRTHAPIHTCTHALGAYAKERSGLSALCREHLHIFGAVGPPRGPSSRFWRASAARTHIHTHVHTYACIDDGCMTHCCRHNSDA